MSKQSINQPAKEDPERAVFRNNPFQENSQAAKVIAVPAQVTIMANDGYANPLASLGASSPIMSSGTFVRSGLTSQTEELAIAYRECAIAKRIIDMPSEDITRGWYTPVSTQVDETDLNNLKELEAKHSIKQEITNGIRWGRLFGGTLALMVIKGEEYRMDEPLDIDELKVGSFKGLFIADLTQGIAPSIELEENLDDPDYGLPKYYDISMELGEIRTVRVHHSRVLRFTGRELPHSESVRNNYWGASELEHPWDEIRRYLSTCENIGQLVFQANLITLKIGNFGSDLAFGSERLKQSVQQTIENENRMRTSYGMQIIGTEDSMENHAYNFAGLAEMKESFMLDVAGAAEIPASRLFGRSPEGMNATGKEDLRNYYDMIAQQQERILRPAMEKLLPVMVMSCWGFVPDDLKIVFNPVMTVSPEESVRVSRENAEEIIALVNSGIFTREEGRAEIIRRSKTYGNWGAVP